MGHQCEPVNDISHIKRRQNQSEERPKDWQCAKSRGVYSFKFEYLTIIVIMVDQLCGMMLIVANTIQIWVCVCEQATPPSILMVYEYAKCESHTTAPVQVTLLSLTESLTCLLCFLLPLQALPHQLCNIFRCPTRPSIFRLLIP